MDDDILQASSSTILAFSLISERLVSGCVCLIAAVLLSTHIRKIKSRQRHIEGFGGIIHLGELTCWP